jgi:hypothetical protein
MPAQLLFAQAGEVVRWAPQGGPFQVIGRGEVVGALETSAAGDLLAFVTQDPATSTVTATVHLVDISGEEAMSWTNIAVETEDDLNLEYDGEFALAVARDEPVAAWSAPGAVYVWRPGDEAASRVDWCNAVLGNARPDPCTHISLSADGARVTYRDVTGWRTSTTSEPFETETLGPGPSGSASPESDVTPTPRWRARLAELAEGLAGADWDALETADGDVVVLNETGPGAVDGPRVVLLAADGPVWDLSGLLAGASHLRLAGPGGEQ